MRMLFKQRILSLLDSYDIYDEDGNVLFIVEGRWSWSHHLEIYDANHNYLASIKQRVFTFLPKFEIYLEDRLVGTISSEFFFFKPRYNIDFNGWRVEGQVMEWDYDIIDRNNEIVAHITKELFHWSDTYIIDTRDDCVLMSLLVVLAIDCEKCSRSN